MKESIVAVIKGKGEVQYRCAPPFYPPKNYPEYPFDENDIDSSNEIYPLVRKLLFYLGLDKDNYGKKEWNPLKEVVRSGDKVVIKPNLVLHFNASGQDINAVITHGSVIRVIMDYVYIALQGEGEITIADAPQMNADFDRITRINGLREVVKYYNRKTLSTNINVDILDLRRERTIYKYGIVWKRIKLNGDPKSYVIVDLESRSEFKNIDCSNVYGADYNRNETQQAHAGGSHKYFISRTILDADVVISIPKMKVHRKAGATLNLKNIVGINGNKNYILHYRIGSPEEKGDETTEYHFILRIDRKLRDLLLGKIWQFGKYPYVFWFLLVNRLGLLPKDEIERGDWYGNDTVWRGALDLNKILFYADKEGHLQEKKCRRYFSIIDGIIAGEGEGPLSPKPKYCGVLVGGINPICVDLVATRLMDFDYQKIPLLRHALNIDMYPLYGNRIKDIIINSDLDDWKSLLKGNKQYFKFEPPIGWKGHIEL